MMASYMDCNELVEQLLASDDDYEPYGMAYSLTDKTGYIQSEVPFHSMEDTERWLGE